jgi:hypothetical protein
MNRDGQTFKVMFTTYLVIERLDDPGADLPYSNVGHRIVSLTTGKTLKVSEAYLADLEEKGKRLT